MQVAAFQSRLAARIVGRRDVPSATGARTRPAAGYDSAPRGPRQMYEAVCSGCGNIASVPFQPSADKPVYCSTCFEQRRGAAVPVAATPAAADAATKQTHEGPAQAGPFRCPGLGRHES